MERKEAMKILKDFHDKSALFSVRTALDTVFPEFVESEDERIRKGIIQYLEQSQFGEEHYQIDDDIVRNYIAWLEKQGEQKPTAEEVLIKAGLKPYKDGDQWCVLLGDNIQEGICGFGNTIEDALYAFLKDLIASQGEQKLDGTFVNVDDVREDFVNEVYRVLDADSTNDRANQIIDAFDNLPTVTIGKQGEQKPAKNIVETWKDMRLEVYQQASGNRHEPNYSDDTTKMFSLSDIDEIIEKMSEQKPADKVEPKFKVGDWVIDKQGLVHQIANVIENVTCHTYAYDIVGGGYFNDNTEGVRLWTIKDAKDGDVIADGNLPFIFKKIDANKYSYAYCGISVDDGFKIKSDGESGEWTWMQDIKPATKEQRNLLFKKMHEAGYEWDAEKKELKKIEQKPAEWSEEDEKQRRQIERIVSNDGCTKKLQEQIHNWFESLKGRVQAQSQWKPTDEQMLAINTAINVIGKGTINGKYLVELHEQLLKLKEE